MWDPILLGDPIPLGGQDVPVYETRAPAGFVGWNALFSHLISLRDQVFFSSFSQSNARDPTRSVQIARAWKHLESQPEAAKETETGDKKTRLKKQPEIPVRHAGQSSEIKYPSQNTPKCCKEAHPQ